MKGSFRQSMDWLHTWAGVVFGAALYMVFLGGTAAVFKEETTTWMTPEIGRAGTPAQALALAEARLKSVASDGRNWSINLPDPRNPATRISWRAPDARTVDGDAIANRETLDSRTGRAVEPRETRGGDLFYRLHYRFEITGRKGWWLSGAAGVLMLVLIVSGVVVHKRIFKDFFTFRPKAHPLRSWLDAHVTLAVLLLPFHVMITYTGLVPIMSTVMPWAMIAAYGDERPAIVQAFDPAAMRQAFQRDREAEPRRRPPGAAADGGGAPLPLTVFLAKAEAHWAGRYEAARVGVAKPNDPAGVVEVSARPEGRLSNRAERLRFRAGTGEMLDAPRSQRPVAGVQSVLYGLHMARFSGPGLRWAYFLAGLASTAMIAGGMIQWSIKRRPKRPGQPVPFGHRLVERVNIAAIVGLPIAMAGLFWANRLLPVGLERRAEAETLCFFLTWIAAAVAAAVRPLKGAWAGHLWFAALAFGLLPLLNAVTTRHNLVASLVDGNWLMAGFDLTMAAVGAGFAAAAWRMAKPAALPRRRLAPGGAA